MPNKIIHGGNLHEIEHKYQIPMEKLVDFSGNVNPLGFPESVKKAITEGLSKITTYPDVNYEGLKKAISHYTGAKSQNILVGNGSTELIALFIKTVKSIGGNKKALLIAPSYGEYERELQNCGFEYDTFSLLEEQDFEPDVSQLITALTHKYSLIILCNPNNPTGKAIYHEDMEKLLMHCRDNSIFVMIDETYAEFCESTCVETSVFIDKYDNLFTIRGTSKFFAIPGLRLGYALCSGYNILSAFSASQYPWSVNSLADAAGQAMFHDSDFINKTKKLIISEKKHMFERLARIKCIKAYKSQSNFILIKLLPNCPLNSNEIFEKVLETGYLIRDCDGYSFLDNRFIRICVLMPSENQLLISNLKKILECV